MGIGMFVCFFILVLETVVGKFIDPEALDVDCRLENGYFVAKICFNFGYELLLNLKFLLIIHGHEII